MASASDWAARAGYGGQAAVGPAGVVPPGRDYADPDQLAIVALRSSGNPE